ncbi:MAG TPA: PfkB family carbohydrate kinase [Candidatus Acidoferrum sp.]|nr:PfkB family carbohydrate kinase [Candidatus Acidoferrum sp.]
MKNTGSRNTERHIRVRPKPSGPAHSKRYSELDEPLVLGIGINATDTVIRLPRFPTVDSKVEVTSAEIKAGGQVASAMVACRRWGLRARYAGKIGDDPAGQFQREEMDREDVETYWITARGEASQSAFILVDEPTGERTVLWKRDPAIALRPEDMRREWLQGASALLVDGHDTEAATLAAGWAREEGLPVVADLDNRYPRVEALLQVADHPITSKDFPGRLTGERDLLRALPRMHAEFKCRLTGATLGRFGVIVWDGTRFVLCPGFRVNATDTTGAGDVFHGAFLYGLVHGWALKETLEFSCAAAALNCEALGARGGIRSIEEIRRMQRHGARSEAAFEPKELLEAANAALAGSKR